MNKPRFKWADPLNSHGKTLYDTPMWLPNVDEGYEANKTVKKTLGGGVIVITQLNRTGGARMLPQYILTWEVSDPDFLPIAQETWDKDRQVTVTLPIKVDYDSTKRFTTKDVSCSVLEFLPKEEKGRLTSLRIVLQEVGI